MASKITELFTCFGTTERGFMSALWSPPPPAPKTGTFRPGGLLHCRDKPGGSHSSQRVFPDKGATWKAAISSAYPASSAWLPASLQFTGRGEKPDPMPRRSQQKPWAHHSPQPPPVFLHGADDQVALNAGGGAQLFRQKPYSFMCASPHTIKENSTLCPPVFFAS